MALRGRETTAFAVALLLHAAAIALLGSTRRAPLSDATPAPSSESELHVELDAPLVATEPNAVAVAPSHEPAQRVARLPDHGVPPSPEPSADDVEPNEATGDDPEAPVAEPDTTAPQRPIDLGIGPDGWQRWVKRPKPGERRAQAPPRPRANRFRVYRAPPASTTGGLLEGLEERDRSLGLGPAGRVLSALHRAAHESFAPQLGTVRFDVTVLRSGAVEVTLRSATNEVDSWNEVAARVADDLRAAPPRIPAPRKGVRLTVELVAEETMPNGTKVRSLRGPHLEVEPPKLTATDRSIEQMRRDNPTASEVDSLSQPAIQLDLPGVYLAERGKVCSYRLGLSVAGLVFQGGCDPSHLGAKPQRMVRTRVVDESMF